MYNTGSPLINHQTYKIKMSEETEQTEQTEQTEPSITINDFTMMVNIIDVCSKRGAFEGKELKDVGIVRDRLAEFVEYHKPKAEDQSELDLQEGE